MHSFICYTIQLYHTSSVHKLFYFIANISTRCRIQKYFLFSGLFLFISSNIVFLLLSFNASCSLIHLRFIFKMKHFHYFILLLALLLPFYHNTENKLFDRKSKDCKIRTRTSTVLHHSVSRFLQMSPFQLQKKH